MISKLLLHAQKLFGQTFYCQILNLKKHTIHLGLIFIGNTFQFRLAELQQMALGF